MRNKLAEGVAFEVAIENLGADRQRFQRAIAEENEKAEPSKLLIHYCNERLKLIGYMQDELRETDLDLIKQINTMGDPLFRKN